MTERPDRPSRLGVCPEAELVGAHAERRLAGEQAAKMDAHIASCPICSQVFADAIRALDQDAAAKPAILRLKFPLPAMLAAAATLILVLLSWQERFQQQGASVESTPAATPRPHAATATPPAVVANVEPSPARQAMSPKAVPGSTPTPAGAESQPSPAAPLESVTHVQPETRPGQPEEAPAEGPLTPKEEVAPTRVAEGERAEAEVKPHTDEPAGESEEEKSLTFTDTVVVSGSKVEEKVIDSPATISVITSEAIAANPAQNFGDLLRAVPGMTVIQTSARDINLSTRNSSTTTLNNSQLTLLDGRSIYLDFFGMVLWDWVPTSSEELKQIEVVRGPASVVWGANALTGIVNIITKPPREAEGVVVTLNGGAFDRDCEGSIQSGGQIGKPGCSQTDTGYNYGGNISIARAPNERWSYKISGGYFNSDAFSRPTGVIPRVPDPRSPGSFIGGAPYPADGDGIGAFQNNGTSQPKVDVRIDNDQENGARLSLQGGYAGTEGIIHTGIGPFDIQSGSYMAYGRAGYTQGGFKAAVFGNFVDAEAPNLLQNDPNNPGTPIQLNFTTQTYDVELGYTRVLGGKHILSLGGNARRNNFDITIAPNSDDRNEFGAYLQDELFFDKWRIAAGVRVDKFGNLSDPVFSPRVSVMFKPTKDHSIRGSFNRAFRSPSVINNFIDLDISNLSPIIDLRGLAPFLPPALRPSVAQPFFLTVNLAGSEVVEPRYDLKEEQLDAFEIAYTGTFNRRTTFGLAVYQNDKKDNINFTSLLPSAQFPNGLPGLTFYSPTNPASGITVTGQPITLPPVLMGILGLVPPPVGPIRLPETVFSYLNLGPVRDRGVEVSLDHYFNENLTGFVNYTWQDDLQVLDAAADEIPYPNDEIALPPNHRFNVGLNWNSKRFLGMAQANYVDDALWSDVLTTPFHGFTDSYTLVNASFGVKWNDGKITTTVKCTNLLNEAVQQHIFGDILKRSVQLELKLKY